MDEIVEGEIVEERDLNKVSGWLSASGGNGGSCVELLKLPGGGFAARDSKDNGNGPVLRFNEAETQAFFDGLRTGVFDSIICE